LLTIDFLDVILDGIDRFVEPKDTSHTRFRVTAAHAALSFEGARCAISQSSSTPDTPWIDASLITRPQCSGAMLPRSRICRAASYLHPIALANSPIVGQ